MADTTVSLPGGRKIKVRKRIPQKYAPTPKLPQKSVVYEQPSVTVQSDPAVGDELKSLRRGGEETRELLKTISTCGTETKQLVKDIRDSIRRTDKTLSIEVTERDRSGNIKAVSISGV